MIVAVRVEAKGHLTHLTLACLLCAVSSRSLEILNTLMWGVEASYLGSVLSPRWFLLLFLKYWPRLSQMETKSNAKKVIIGCAGGLSALCTTFAVTPKAFH